MGDRQTWPNRACGNWSGHDASPRPRHSGGKFSGSLPHAPQSTGYEVKYAARGRQVQPGAARRREAWSDGDDGGQVADPVEVAGFAGEVRADRAGDDVRDPEQGIRRSGLVVHAQLSIEASLGA